MDLEGRFTSPDNLADVMKRVATEMLSGVLTIRCGVTSASSFFYHKGQLSGSDNPDRHRRLGRILLNRGLIDRAALEEALAYQADFAPGTPIGAVLVHRDRLSENDLRDAVRIQIEDELSTALNCIDGFYRFEPSDPAADENPLVLLTTHTVVNETMARQQEWQRIRQKVPSDSVIPSVVKLGGPADREVLHLNTKEWHVLSLVNGYFDVGCIAERSGLGRFETYKVLETLLSSGVVELQTPRDPVTESLNGYGGDPAPAENPAAKSSGSSSSRWGNILARLRDEEQVADNGERDTATMLQFDSPVSFLAEVSNRIIHKLMVNQDFVVDPSDEKLTERYWRQVLMTFPKADLVSAKENLLDATNFDRYTRSLGVEGPMHSIYLDTMDALTRYLRTLYLLSAQRLGSRVARTTFVDVMDDVKGRATIANSESFYFKQLATEILA